MDFRLGTNVKVGEKIRLPSGWHVVKEILPNGVRTKNGFVQFGAVIYGWKAR